MATEALYRNEAGGWQFCNRVGLESDCDIRGVRCGCVSLAKTCLWGRTVSPKPLRRRQAPAWNPYLPQGDPTRKQGKPWDGPQRYKIIRNFVCNSTPTLAYTLLRAGVREVAAKHKTETSVTGSSDVAEIRKKNAHIIDRSCPSQNRFLNSQIAHFCDWSFQRLSVRPPCHLGNHSRFDAPRKTASSVRGLTTLEYTKHWNTNVREHPAPDCEQSLTKPRKIDGHAFERTFPLSAKQERHLPFLLFSTAKSSCSNVSSKFRSRSPRVLPAAASFEDEFPPSPFFLLAALNSATGGGDNSKHAAKKFGWREKVEEADGRLVRSEVRRDKDTLGLNRQKKNWTEARKRRLETTPTNDALKCFEMFGLGTPTVARIPPRAPKQR